jgi:2'-deoxymugineic-acid 2'-dioxygenase/mugineic-acid 3-dioxygenase
MENLLSSAPSHATLPDRFVFPPDQRPPASTCTVSLPVIDLSRGRDEVRRAVLDAGKELGFFQASQTLSHPTLPICHLLAQLWWF